LLILVLDVENPRLRTLLSFLNRVGSMAPANFTALCEGGWRGYGMVSQYLRFCLEQRLIRVVAERRETERYPSRDYDLSEKGWRLLKIFEELGALESPGEKNTWRPVRQQP
jgi:DNA-binding PadR family transcriptional regulator